MIARSACPREKAPARNSPSRPACAFSSPTKGCGRKRSQGAQEILATGSLPGAEARPSPRSHHGGSIPGSAAPNVSRAYRLPHDPKSQGGRAERIDSTSGPTRAEASAARVVRVRA